MLERSGDRSGTCPGPVVAFPEEFDFGNAEAGAERLRAAIAPGGSAVVAELTTTATFDASGVRILLLAWDWAGDVGAAIKFSSVPLTARRPSPTFPLT